MKGLPVVVHVLYTLYVMVVALNYFCSEVLSGVTDKLQRAVDEVCETIQSICDDNHWLGDVWKFVNSWQGRSRAASMSAEELEVVTE